MSDRESIALAWWGSLKGGGPTAGDLLALRAAHRALIAEGYKVQVICHPLVGSHVAGWAEVVDMDRGQSAALVWVCGPLIGGSPAFIELFNQFRGKPRIAVGVSVLPRTSADHFDEFDICLARDGLGMCHGDLALAAPLGMAPTAGPRRTLSLCLRGAQREYGLARSGHEKVAGLCERLGIGCGAESTIDTRLDRPSATIRLIEQQFANSRLVITSRLHGALLALRRGVPVIAIDQIEGGGKVSQVLSRLGWPWIFSAHQLERRELETVASHLWEKGAESEVAETHRKAAGEARGTLQAMTMAIAAALRGDR